LWTGAGKIDVLAWSEIFAGTYNATIVSIQTILHGVILYIHIPAVDKVGMKSVACRVTVRKDKLPTPRLINLIGKIKDSVEYQRREFSFT